VIFFIKGIVDLGFMINRKETYCLRLHKDSLLGAYNLCTNKRTKFIYKSVSHCSGYFIRRSNWKSIMDNPELEHVTACFEKSVTTYYKEKIYKRMVKEKQQMISKQKKRADYQAIISLKDVKRNLKTKDETVMIEEEYIKNDIASLHSKVEKCEESNSKILDCFD